MALWRRARRAPRSGARPPPTCHYAVNDTVPGMGRPPSGPLAHMVLFGYDTRAMLSRAQEARVREVLGGHAPGIFPAYCLEHLAATAQIPPAHLADVAAFVRNFRACGGCQTQFGDATPGLLISARRIPPPPQETRRVS
jgi:hypothetical protein